MVVLHIPKPIAKRARIAAVSRRAATYSCFTRATVRLLICFIAHRPPRPPLQDGDAMKQAENINRAKALIPGKNHIRIEKRLIQLKRASM